MKEPTARYPVGITWLHLNRRRGQLNPPFRLPSISLNACGGSSLYLSHSAPIGMPVMFAILRACALSTFQKAPTYPTTPFHQDPTSPAPPLLQPVTPPSLNLSSAEPLAFGRRPFHLRRSTCRPISTVPSAAPRLVSSPPRPSLACNISYSTQSLPPSAFVSNNRHIVPQPWPTRISPSIFRSFCSCRRSACSPPQLASAP